MPDTSPTLVRRQLGRRLRLLRKEVGKTDREVEEARLASRTKLWRIESGRGPIRIGDVRALCCFYGVDGQTSDALANMAKATLDRNWWEVNRYEVRPWFDLYVGLEASASRIRCYEPELVHGLFQTEEYARAVHESCMPEADPVSIDQAVRFRVQRQETVFGRTNPPKITAIVNPSVLMRPVGGKLVWERQIQKLQTMAALPNIDLRVIPWQTGAHPIMIGCFSVFDFDDPNDPSVVYIDLQTNSQYIEDESAVTEYGRLFKLTLDQTVPIEEFLK